MSLSAVQGSSHVPHACVVEAVDNLGEPPVQLTQHL